MKYVIAVILTAAVVSFVTAKIIAAYHFKVIDSYVRDMVEIAKHEIKKAYINQGKH